MKTVNIFGYCRRFKFLSFAGFAAVEVQSTLQDRYKVGTISASAGINLAQLEDQLAQSG